MATLLPAPINTPMYNEQGLIDPLWSRWFNQLNNQIVSVITGVTEASQTDMGNLTSINYVSARDVPYLVADSTALTAATSNKLFLTPGHLSNVAATTAAVHAGTSNTVFLTPANLSILLGYFMGTLTNIQAFTASGTYTPTSGTTYAFVQCWGAGAGGASTTSGTDTGASGGGGAYAAGKVTITTTVTVTIGTGGTGATANSGTTGTNGTATSFGASIIAAGGTSPANGNSTQGGAGGTIAASTGTIVLAGEQGSASNNIAGKSWLSVPSSGGSSPFMGVRGQFNYMGSSGPANSGAGGNAGFATTAAGNGGSGYCVIFEFTV